MIIIDEILASIKFVSNFFIIGIDGPTASGKTTLADALGRELGKREIPFFIYRLDWALTERAKRQEDLNIIRLKNAVFEYEASLHMDLIKARKFLSFIDSEQQNEALRKKEVTLSGLYSRENNGTCDGVANFVLKKKMVIIVEGHYTHHHLLRNFFDRNYLLVARPEELIRRKSGRAASYRSACDVKKYFSLIDLPSYSHYYEENKAYIDHIFLNETLNEQQRLSHQKLQKILFNQVVLPDASPGHVLIPVFHPNADSLIKSIDILFSNLVDLHQKLVQLWGIHPQYRIKSLTQEVAGSLSNINVRLKYSSFHTHESNIFSYEFGLVFDNLFFLVTGNLKSITVAAVSEHTKRLFRVTCNANGIISKPDFNMVLPEKANYRVSCALAPNKFLTPHFLQQIEGVKLVYYKTEEKLWEHIEMIFSNPVLMVVRIKKSGHQDFMKKFFKTAGFQVFKYDNYFFIQSLSGKNLNNIFTFFCNELPRITNFSKQKKEFSKKDSSILQKLGAVQADGQLFFTSSLKHTKLVEYYREAGPFIKNKLTHCLYQQYPQKKVFNGISLGKYIRNLPVPLKDFYLSLAVSKPGAVPFISLYHLKNNGVDIQTYFNYFSSEVKPFGIQASLNALGTYKENGYLNIKGPAEMADVIRNNLISFIRKNMGPDLPLWGLGIDHAAASDSDNLRVIKLLIEAKKTQLITSYCLDTSNLLNNGLNDQSGRQINGFLNKALTLLSDMVADIEYYIGNEEYFSNQTQSESPDVFRKLAHTFRNTAKSHDLECNFLFGPFIGTQHHQQHLDLDLKTSEQVFNKTKPYGFVGSVLHGTSYTSQSQIEETVKRNFIRINYAGKLLEAIIKSFPEDIRIKAGQTQNEWKHYLVSGGSSKIMEFDSQVQKNLLKVLQGISKVTALPRMDEEEIDWFRNGLVMLPGDDFCNIVCELFGPPQKPAVKKTHENPRYLASMIEVPFNEFSGGLANRIIKAGISDFHIDIGDGNLISRKLDGFEKLEYLRKFHPTVETHIHLMVEDPFSETPGNSYISRICAIKPSLIYIHPETFGVVGSWKRGAEIIRQAKGIPGVVLTVDEKIKTDVFLKKMADAQIKNILVMGVTIGRGGQTFREEALRHLKEINDWADKNDAVITVEVDGGVDDAVIKVCKEVGVSFIAGWSMFLKYSAGHIEKRIKEFLNG